MRNEQFPTDNWIISEVDRHMFWKYVNAWIFVTARMKGYYVREQN
jgi:hypothetical protein